MSAGTLYAIGTGPGAPDLLTLRAVKILGQLDVVFAPASPKNDYSICLNTVREHLPASVNIVRLDFPMLTDPAALEKAWSKAASTACHFLEHAGKCAFLTLGDPLLYSTFIYLAEAILKISPQQTIEIVPGITSFQASAAKTRFPLGKGKEILRIIPGTLDEKELERELSAPDPVVILKAYRKLPEIRRALQKTGRERNAVLVSFVENAQEEMGRLVDWPPDVCPPYMSLILSASRK